MAKRKRKKVSKLDRGREPAAIPKGGETQEVKLYLYWDDEPTLQPVYVNQMWLTQMFGEFFLNFGQTIPTSKLLKREPEENIAVKTVSKLVISGDNLKKFSDIIARQVELQEKRKLGGKYGN